jgi:protein involved in polysaccharide export with SLBB domain
LITRHLGRAAGLVVLVLLLTSATRPDLSPPDTVGMDWSRVPEYRVVPGDILRFNFGPVSPSAIDVVREARVRPDGRISVFPVGEVIAAGRTIRELQGAMVDLMSGEFKLPRVAIELYEVAGNRVHVFGSVRNPGTFPVSPFMTVSQAIAAAGGFENDAASNSVLVFHRDGGRTVQVSRVRLARSLKRASLEGDLPLARFDIVFVPRSTIGNIDQFVRQFFTETSPMFQTPITGWELFHLDRVYVLPGASR